jgi:GAF domain-containing protein
MRRWLAPPVFAGDVERNRVARLANVILLATVGMISLASLIVVLTLRNYVVMGVTFVCLIVPVISALFILRRGHVRVASLITSLTLWLVLVVMGFFFGGVVNTSFTTIVIIIMIAALLLGGRAGVIFAALSFVAVTFTFISGEIGILPPPLGPNIPINYWVTHTVNYGIAALLLYLAMNNLTDTIQRAQRLADESEVQREQLQLLVEQRTRDSERNANYLQATMAVAQETAAAMGDLQVLLPRVVDVIRAQFDMYHVGLYLLDETGEWAELRAVSGAGQELLERGFRLRVGAEGIVGDVALRGTYHLATDVEDEPIYLRMEELPDTSSELTLPLLVGEQVIGVLDVQRAGARGFVPQSVQTLQALADQVAMAISNARLVEQVQQAAETERRAYGALTAEAWTTMLSASQALGFYSTAQTTVPAGDLWQPEMKTALQTGSTTHNVHDMQRLAVPVKVRGEVIGVIDFSKPAGDSTWTDEEIALVESMTEQLGVALDSARLYQDTQRRAVRERLVGEVTSRMRETLDLNTVLQTAVREMGLALDVDEVEVRLGTEIDNPDANIARSEEVRR